MPSTYARLEDDYRAGRLIGFRKSRVGDSTIEPIYKPTPPTRDGNFRERAGLSAAVHRVLASDDAMRIIGDAAPSVADALVAARAAADAPDPDPARIAETQDHFFDQAYAWGADLRAMAGRGGGRVSPRDSAAYSLLGPIVVMPQVVERLIGEPTLIGTLSQIALNTAMETAIYHRATVKAALPTRSWDWGAIAAGGTASVNLEPVNVKLAPSGQAVELTALTKQRGAEARDRSGIPDWNLWDKLLDATMRSVYTDLGLLVAHGEPSFGVKGVLTSGYLPFAGVNYDSGTFLTDYNVMAAQIALQATNANDEPSLVADTLWIDSTTFNKWAGVLISSTGDSTPPFLQVLRSHPSINEVYSTREFRQNASLLAELTVKLGDATEAIRRAGGYIVGGTSKPCILIGRNSPDCGNWISGLPIGVQPIEPMNGSDRAIVSSSTGGFVAFQPNAYRLIYIP